MQKRRKKATETTRRERVVVCASLTAEVTDRLDAFAERVGLPTRSNGEPRRGTAAAMLIAKGLDAAEASV